MSEGERVGDVYVWIRDEIIEEDDAELICEWIMKLIRWKWWSEDKSERWDNN